MKSKFKRVQKRKRKKALRQRINNLCELARKVELIILTSNPDWFPFYETGEPYKINDTIFVFKDGKPLKEGLLLEIENYVQSYWDMKAFL